jgi:5S rRNA maturation endonuclease (ribonuclease M5)
MARPRKGIKYYLQIEAELKAEIEEMNYGTSLVVVEGKHDEKALKKIGLKTPVVQFCNCGLPVFAFIDEIVEDYQGLTVAVLLDFDEEGTKMSERLSKELEERGVKVDRFHRKRLAKILTKEGVFRIEELEQIISRAAY